MVGYFLNRTFLELQKIFFNDKIIKFLKGGRSSRSGNERFN